MNTEKYKFYNYSSYYSFDISLEKDNWGSIQMVSVNSDGKVIGYLNADVNRDTRNVTSLSAINLYDVNYTFSKDFHTFLTDLFDKYKFNKISIASALDNPAIKMYDKYIKKYGGRIVGIRKKHVRLYDGELYDDKLYEILYDEYILNK